MMIITYDSYRVGLPGDFNYVSSGGDYLSKRGDRGIGDYNFVGKFAVTNDIYTIASTDAILTVKGDGGAGAWGTSHLIMNWMSSGTDVTCIARDYDTHQKGIIRWMNTVGEAVTDGYTILSLDAPATNAIESTLALSLDNGEIVDFSNMKYGGLESYWGFRYIRGESTGIWKDFMISSKNLWAGSPVYHLVMKIPSGNIGFGTTDVEAWHTDYRVIEATQSSILFGYVSNVIGLVNNAYYSDSWKYKTANVGAYYEIVSGVHNFYTVASGTIDTAITWLKRMTILNNGLIGIGTDTPGSKLDIYNDASASYARIRGASDGDNYAGFELWSVEATPRKWQFVHKITTYAFDIAHYNGTGWSVPFTITSAGMVTMGQIKITGGSPGASKVLTSDADGVGTWQTASVGSVTCNNDNYAGILVGGGYSNIFSVTVPATGNYLVSFGCGMLESASAFNSYYTMTFKVNTTVEGGAEVYSMSTGAYGGAISMQYPKALTASDVVYLVIDRDHAAGSENTGLYGVYLNVLRVT
jgi:hypothetical protein